MINKAQNQGNRHSVVDDDCPLSRYCKKGPFKKELSTDNVQDPTYKLENADGDRIIFEIENNQYELLYVSDTCSSLHTLINHRIVWTVFGMWSAGMIAMVSLQYDILNNDKLPI